MSTALAFQAFVPDQAERLTAYVHRLVPHEQPELEEVKTATAMALDAACVGNLDLRGQVAGFLDQLEQEAQQKQGRKFVDLEPAAQDELLKAHQATALFQQLLHLTRLDFYNRHIVWQTLGYPGLERRLDGEGYLHEGFDELEW